MLDSKIDHIVYCVPDLKSGIESIQKMTGAKVYPGGKHLNQGTHNAIVRIGEKSYLEIIAKDVENTTLKGARWMGVDYVTDQPRITRWAVQAEVNTSNLNILRQFDRLLGQPLSGSRLKPDGKKLEWEMSMPMPEPMINSCPFLIDWGHRIHPVDELPMECALLDIQLQSTNPQNLKAVLSELGIYLPVVKSKMDRIEAIIKSPFGVLRLY